MCASTNIIILFILDTFKLLLLGHHNFSKTAFQTKLSGVGTPNQHLREIMKLSFDHENLPVSTQ